MPVTIHQYECTGLDLLHSVGIAHLALRTLLVAGMKRLMGYRTEVQGQAKTSNDNETRVDRRPDDSDHSLKVGRLALSRFKESKGLNMRAVGQSIHSTSDIRVSSYKGHYVVEIWAKRRVDYNN